MNEAAIDWIVGRALEALARNEPISPAALIVLVRNYASTGGEEVGLALGPALAAALEGAASVESTHGQSAWLSLFVEAAAISEDERLPREAAALAARLRSGWPARGELEPAVRSLDACLSAARALPDLFNQGDLVPAAVDELERVVRVAYRPGEGIAHALCESTRSPGSLGDHVATAAALLAGYALTGRVPYSMLAEELMQFVGRVNREVGGSTLERFIVRSEAARVLCRMAKLYEDEDFRRIAVVDAGADYADAARRTLDELERTYRDHGVDAAVFGVALGELRVLR